MPAHSAEKRTDPQGLPGVEDDYRIVKPMAPEPDAEPPSTVKADGWEVSVSGTVTSISPLAACHRPVTEAGRTQAAGPTAKQWPWRHWRSGPFVGAFPSCRTLPTGFHFGCQAASCRDPTCGLYDVRGTEGQVCPIAQALRSTAAPRERGACGDCPVGSCLRSSVHCSVACSDRHPRSCVVFARGLRHAGDRKDRWSLLPASPLVNPLTGFGCKSDRALDIDVCPHECQ